jgi:hypothetical protein
MATWMEQFGDLGSWSQGCPVCQGSQFRTRSVAQVVAAFTDASEDRCPCWRIFHANAALWEHGFPRGYLAYNWDASWPLDTTTPPEVLARWQQRFPDSNVWSLEERDERALVYWADPHPDVFRRGLSLVLWGEKGTGKTALATVLVKELQKRRGLDAAGIRGDFAARFVACDELFDLVHGRNGAGQRRSFSELLTADVVVLDDLRFSYGGYAVAEFIERVHYLLQHRAGSNLPTVLTVNKVGAAQDFVPNAVSQFLGIAGGDMPASFGKYRFVQLTNEPLRPEPEWSL